MIKKIVLTFLGLLVGLFFLGLAAASVAVLQTYPNLPPLDAVTRYNPKMPLRIYSADKKLIGIYGEERREFMQIGDFPDVLKNAVIAAEDKRFYEHWGVDTISVMRALAGNISSGRIESGASTITQQVARNFFLTNEQTYRRKFNEMLMAYKIERSLSKDQILELYFNHIYLGQRAYGFAAASQAYFAKPVQEIGLAEAAMLAGLPKAPSAFNPMVNPARARQRQEYILGNMRDLGMIDEKAFQAALAEELVYARARVPVDENSLYVAEAARQMLVERYGEDAYTQGLHVYTTVSSANQKAATEALRKTLDGFDSGRAFRGAEAYVDLSRFPQERFTELAEQYLNTLHTVNGMVPALVLAADKGSLKLLVQGIDSEVVLNGKEMQFVKNAVHNSKMAERQVRPGAVLRVVQDKNGKWRPTQQPELQGALVSINARTGAVEAMVGGYDFYQKEFNRATQAWRQPGSSFKPFIYSAGIERGLTASTQINDGPLSFPGLGPGGSVWSPKNSDGQYRGMMTLHQALVSSRNLVTIRVLMAAGLDYTHQYVQRFGFDGKNQPKSLSMALGSGAVTPLEIAGGYAVFANGGYKVAPYLIDEIYNDNGDLLAKTEPVAAGKNARLVIDPRNAYIMYDILQDVTRSGTAARASALKRSDIAGKTGTTNEQKDAWFVGFNPQTVTAVYIGYDRPRSMGRAGYGGRIALPVWMDYMAYALKGKPAAKMPAPKGMVSRDGEYYYAEWQYTNPALALDNREDVDELGGLIEELEGGVELVPVNPAPAPNRPPARGHSAIDSLF